MIAVDTNVLVYAHREEAPEHKPALGALTEIRSRAGEEAAIEILTREPTRDVLVAAVRYLAEMGREEVLLAQPFSADRQGLAK